MMENFIPLNTHHGQIWREVLQRHTLNTISRGFSGGRETSTACRRYDCKILNIEDLPNVEGGGETQAL